MIGTSFKFIIYIIFFYLVGCNESDSLELHSMYDDNSTSIELFDQNGKIGNILAFDEKGMEVVNSYGFLTEITWAGGYGEEVLFNISQSDLSNAHFFRVVDDSNEIKNYFTKVRDIQGHVFSLYSNDSAIENRTYDQLFVAENDLQQEVVDSAYQINLNFFKSYVCEILACVEYHQFKNVHDMETTTGYRDQIIMPLKIKNRQGEILNNNLNYDTMYYFTHSFN